MGNTRNWWIKFHSMGSSYVCQWNESVFWLLFCHNNVNYCSSHSTKGIQLGSNVMAGKYSLEGSYAIRDWLHIYIYPWRANGIIFR